KIKAHGKRCSRSSFGTTMAGTRWRKPCPIHQSISAIRTRKSSKARGGYSTKGDFPRFGSTKSWTNAVLTRGGVYRQFMNKEQLYAEAVRRFLCIDAPKPWQSRSSSAEIARKPRSQRVVDAYFSRDHFYDRETCCPLIAFPSDVMRGSDTVKGAYREVLEKL